MSTERHAVRREKIIDELTVALDVCRQGLGPLWERRADAKDGVKNYVLRDLRIRVLPEVLAKSGGPGGINGLTDLFSFRSRFKMIRYHFVSTPIRILEK